MLCSFIEEAYAHCVFEELDVLARDDVHNVVIVHKVIGKLASRCKVHSTWNIEDTHRLIVHGTLGIHAVIFDMELSCKWSQSIYWMQCVMLTHHWS